jgi:hypothetical protein
MSVVNSYTHRKVAETAAKGCDVCYRATSSVLVAPENKACADLWRLSCLRMS